MTGTHRFDTHQTSGLQKTRSGNHHHKKNHYSKRKPHRSRHRHSGRFVTAAAAIILFLCIASGPAGRYISGSSVAHADQNLSEIQYKVVEIQKGDTLWSIARDNMGPGYSDIYSYIREIKSCNQLKTNSIRSGGYLMIPFYTVEGSDYASASTH